MIVAVSRRPRYRKWSGIVITGVCALVGASMESVAAQEGTQRAGEEVCSQGVITSIELDRQSVFDPDATSVGALSWTYRALNVLHIRTAPSFIRRELLFQEGDCYDPFLVSESERLLTDYDFLSQARITNEDDGEGGQRLVVTTQDEWSTQVDMGLTYDEGVNLEKFQVTEQNFLGQGIFAEFTHRERRETRLQAFGLATPRFFGRADASVQFGKARPGRTFDQYIRYPFIGETGEYSFRQGYSRRTDFFSYATDGSEVFSQVLLPAFRELMELSFAKRFGPPGRSFIAGVTLTRDVVRFPDEPQVTVANNFNDLETFPGALPPLLAGQRQPSGATRVALQFGTRRFRYEEYRGLDGVRDRELVGLGFFAGVTLGRGFDALVPEGLPGLDDYFGRLYGSFGAGVGSSLFHGGFTVETRRDRGDWQDLLTDADVVAYLRNDALRAHTFFVRASTAGGWRTGLPYQLSLGGREGVRSLAEDRFPGARMARFVVEDRIALPWPPAGTADLGMTAFADLGRVWPGDVPYAVDSGWQAALGVGLRIGVPSGTRQVIRADIAFPVGATSGSAIFRVTFEVNRLRDGFFTPDVLRSRRFDLGPDHF